MRLTAAVLLALAAAPGLWWRAPSHPEGERTHDLTITRLELGHRTAGGGEVSLEGAWELRSGGSHFSGYSALVEQPGDRLRAYSDRGFWLEFDKPDRSAQVAEQGGDVRRGSHKGFNDIEAAAYDAASGTTWLALEMTNVIRRFAADGSGAADVPPPAMAKFLANGGPEAMARLPDGRFVVLAEAAQPFSPMRRSGLLFARDPLDDASATAFWFVPPPGFDPTDAAALPDGRIVVLLRKLSLGAWPFFRSRLVVADPAEIAAGRPLPWREIADLTAIAPRENYEGLAVEQAEDGLVLWLISDANRNVVLQRTLLLKLVWREGGGRREAGAGSGLRRPFRPS